MPSVKILKNKTWFRTFSIVAVENSSNEIEIYRRKVARVGARGIGSPQHLRLTSLYDSCIFRVHQSIRNEAQQIGLKRDTSREAEEREVMW